MKRRTRDFRAWLVEAISCYDASAELFMPKRKGGPRRPMGCRLEVVPVGKGWRVSIYPPDSASALRESPAILEKVLKETVIAEAKKIVDARAATN